MKVLDVDLLHDGLIRNINRMNRLEKEITAIQKAVSELTAMEEALKGEGGQAIRDFYTSCHLPFLQYFLSFKEEFNTVLQQAQQALVSLEPVDAGHIVEEFLETKVEEGLTESATITATLTDEANAIMDEVSDIVGLPKLDDTLVQESVADAKTKRDDTVEALHTFDSTQTTQLVPIESSIQSMKEWVQNIEGLFQEGLTDVNFPTDKWSSITGNSAIAMSLSAMGVENGIDSQEMLACERPVETDVKEDKAWYKVVGDVLVGIAEGVAKAIADIFTGLFDLLKNLFTDPVGFFGGLATAIMNPIDTAKQMWGAVEAAWERDVVNGDARSRAEFFSYAVVSVVGLKGVDKLGKAGKVGNAASKADNALPYNAMKTDKLKETLKTNVYATVQQKAQQAADFWKSNFSKEAINKTIEAAKNSAVITKAKNVIEPANIKAAAAKTYQNVVKTPIAKTQAALKAKKEQLLDMPLPNFGLSPVPLGPTTNMTVREGIEAAKDTVMQVVGKQDGGGERVKIKGNGTPLKLEDFTKEILETKPMNSRIPKKWYDKGGEISIDNDGTWTYTNKSGVSVSYPDGYPDFTPFMHPNVKPVKIKVHSPKNNPKDFENANIEAKLSKDTDPPIFDIRRPPIGYTWHHHQDGETMLLVVKDIHDEFKHIGGQSKVNGKNRE
ncbi:T7SS effector LXG polymorphic toxin [Lysinibacillus sp. 3P01SB]|uniref:T7SS effector LXG polymorphic toxin n=1 Tax=Lysinibacillus sp. 3P01SB TaxID=3132284 RepID=UPI0039A65678